MARPSSYDEAIADAICECIASGDSMREAARKQGLSESTVREWRKSNEAFSAQYAHAVTARAEVFFERGNDIAMAITTGEEAQIARVQLDWLKWSASKLGPKQYGDKVENTLLGANGGVIQHEIKIEFVKTGTDAS
jgi:transposase-like protein